MASNGPRKAGLGPNGPLLSPTSEEYRYGDAVVFLGFTSLALQIKLKIPSLVGSQQTSFLLNVLVRKC